MPDTSRVRLSIVGVVVMALFCSLLARLWFLQVRNSTTNVQINDESIRTVHNDSPRGLILDRSGTVLAGNQVVWTVIADPALRNKNNTKLRAQMVPKLARLLGESDAQVTKALNDERVGPLQPAAIAQNVSPRVRTILAEQSHDYPHIALQAIDERSYPAGATVAPQVLGYTGLVDSADLKRHPDYLSNGTIGRAGIEQVYDSELRGTPSTAEVNVNPAGVVVGSPVHTIPGKPGHDVQLTIDAGVQRSVQQSLQAGIAQAQQEDNVDLVSAGFPGHTYRAPAGSAVVLDTTNGNVVAMASYPTYPNSANISAEYNSLMNPHNDDPLLNRVTSGLYAPGSTFKLITAQAAVDTGTRSIDQTIDDTGTYTATSSLDHKQFGSPDKAGVVDLQEAITKSSDVYFYGIGDLLYQQWAAGNKASGYAIQNLARDFGFGAKTKVDVDESAGLVPDAEWRKAFVTHEHKLGIEPYKSNEQGYIQWEPGDNINLSVGQGDLLVTPLQLADAYAAFANGGTLWQPRLVQKIVDPSNNSAKTIATQALRSGINVRDDLRQAMLQGFQGVVQQTAGTAYAAFQGFNFNQNFVYGKTGTAQVGTPVPQCISTTPGHQLDKCIGDTSWFVGMFGGSDQNHPRYVVVVNVEQGGFGGRIAAPVARQIIEKMEHLPETPIPDIPASADR
jgi:penicillin-binding protein 2